MDEGRLRQIVREEIRKGRVVEPDPLRPDNIRLRWRDWIPTYTDLTVGNGTVVARYARAGRTVYAHFHLTFGSSTTIDASGPKVSAPVPLANSYVNLQNSIGTLLVTDTGTTTHPGFIRIAGGEFQPMVMNAAATYARGATLSSTVPMTWTTDDRLAFSVTYEAAA